MKSYKNWKLINESFFPGMTLGLAHPQNLGLQSDLPGVSLSEKKKSHGKVVSDDDGECGCRGKKEVKFAKKMKKNMRDKYPSKEEDDRFVDRSPEGRRRARIHADADIESDRAASASDDDDLERAAKQSASFPGYKVKQNMKKGMKKKMKKHMHDDIDVDDVEDFDKDGGDDDVNDVDVPDDDHDDEEGDHDEPDGDEDGEDFDDDGDGDEDDEDHDEIETDDDGDGEFGGEEDDDGDDAPKFGFMKDKKKDWKKKRKDENAFWADVEANYRVPKNEQGTDEEFFDSLSRQYGNPMVRFSGGVDRVDEDLLLSPEQQALIDAMPQPGEVGYAPTQRLGGGFSGAESPVLGHLPYGESQDYDDEDAADYEVLCKYFSESVALDLIQKKKEHLNEAFGKFGRVQPPKPGEKMTEPTEEDLIYWLVDNGWNSPEASDYVRDNWYDARHAFIRNMPPLPSQAGGRGW